MFNALELKLNIYNYYMDLFELHATFPCMIKKTYENSNECVEAK